MKTSRLSRRLSFFRFYRTVSSISLSKSAKLSGINSSTPNNFDQIWELKTVRLKNPKNVMTINLNINSISGKFNQLKCLIQNHVDILVLTETKLDDEAFTTSSFLIDGFSSPFRLYRNRKGSSILTYMRGDISSKSLTKHNFPNDIEGLFVEINFRKRKLLFGTHHPPSQNDQYYFECIDKALDIYNSYEKVIFTGDFNAQENECAFDSFPYQQDLINLVEVSTSYKNPRNPSCIHLYLTNSPLSF